MEQNQRNSNNSPLNETPSDNVDKSDNSKEEKTIICHPVVVSSGDCQHYYEWVFTDEEGVENARCVKGCWMGIRYRKSEYELVDGQLKRISKKEKNE